MSGRPTLGEVARGRRGVRPVCAERLVRLARQARALSDLVAAWDQDEELPVAVEALGRFLGNVADEIEHSCHFTGK